MPKGNGSRTFIKITNKDIYCKIEALEKMVREFNEHGINERQKMKGKIAMNRWIAGGGIATAGYAVCWLWAHVSGG